MTAPGDVAGEAPVTAHDGVAPDPAPDAGSDALVAAPDAEPDADETAGVPRPLALGLGIALVLLVVLGGFALQAHRGASSGTQRAAAREQALTAARQEALNLTSVDATDIDGDLKRVQDGATGNFGKDFSAQAASLRKVLKDNAVQSVGQIKDAGLVSFSAHKATVIVIANSTVKNKAIPTGTPRNYRMRLELVKSAAGRWKTDKLEFVG